jgi:pimeloyl-ACP methyl ester carboxylesterase
MRKRKSFPLCLAVLALLFSSPVGSHASTNSEFSALSPLLEDAYQRIIKSKSGWLKQRAVIRRQWLDFLGPLPAKKPALKTEILNTEHLSGFTRLQVRYQIESDIYTDGYLLTPVGAKGRLPAVIVFHPTTPLHAKGVAGLASEYDPEKWQGVQLVQRGYVVWCPRNYINTDGADWTGNAKRVLAAHPDWTGMTRMVWDAIRAVDFVQSLPNVDRRRIGVLGHSLGGKQALYAAAFDERIQAAVSSEGGIGLRFSNWDALWYLGPKIREPDFKLEHHQLLALIAPRAFLLLGGESADGERSGDFIDAAQPVYELLDARENLKWFNHHDGHRYSPTARAKAEQFLDEQLKSQ